MFNIEQFLQSLQYMWQGMLCIFVVMAVIILSVVVMNFISGKAAKRKELKEKNEDN